MKDIQSKLVDIEDLIKELREIMKYDNFKIDDAQNLADEIEGIASGFWSNLSDIEQSRCEQLFD